MVVYFVRFMLGLQHTHTPVDAIMGTDKDIPVGNKKTDLIAHLCVLLLIIN